jgi:hypothetical protein
VKREPIDCFTEICQITQKETKFFICDERYLSLLKKPKETIESCIFDFSDMRLYAEDDL